MSTARKLSVVREGKPFVTKDLTFIEVSTLNAHELASLREAVVNSIEAGATVIDIFPNKEGKVVVFDNGCGMSAKDLAEFMQGFGTGNKTRGRTANMGVGLKAVGAIQNPNGVEITSWKRSDVAHQIVLGRLDEHLYGILTTRDGLVRSVRPPKYEDIDTSHGTQVVLNDTEFRPYVIRKFLNERLITVPKGVRISVWSENKGELASREVIGAARCVERLCDSWGTLKLESCRIIWGLRKQNVDEQEQAALEAFAANNFQAPPILYAWNGEVYNSWEFSKGGRQKLASWGIRAGAKEIILIVEARGNRIAPAIDRCSISGWDEAEAQLEFADNLPDELLSFMDGWERSHFDISFQDAGVALFLSEIGSPVVEFDSRSPGTRPPRTGGSGGSSGGGGGGEGGRRRRHRGARALGRPSVVGVDAAELGNSLVSYDADYNRICINYEHPRFGWMKGLSPRLDGEVKIIIHAMVSNSFTEHVDEFNDVPQDEQLFSAVTAASAAARYKKANPRKFITPRVEQKD